MFFADLAVALAGRVPLGVANAFAWALAWTWWWVLPFRRRVAVDNLRAALPEAPPRATLTRMMHDIVLGYVEIARYRRESDQLRHGARPEGGWPEEPSRTVQIAVDLGGIPPGCILVGGHSGSFDLYLLAIADRLPIAVFFKTPASAWARDRLREVRTAHDILGLETGAKMADGYRALEAGRCVFFVQDQRYAKGIDSPFFGRPARTSTGLAAAVLRTGRPVWSAWGWRDGPGRHHVVFRPMPLPPLTGDRAMDLQALTDAMNRFYEAGIRTAPHGWLWLHRRWAR